VKLLAAFVFAGTLALAQDGPSPGKGTVICPLSDSQVKKSMDAFAKIYPVLTEEPRCVNCHGGVNPFIDGVGKDPSQPDVVPSKFEHGAGKVEHTTKCSDCHNNMVPPTRAEPPSTWTLAPSSLAFVGKDARRLCKQIRGQLPTAKLLIGHFTDDNGGDNFTGTAYKGDRALDRSMFSESEIPNQPPHILHADLIKLGSDWVAAQVGEFKGSPPCGCEPAHYALRISASTTVDLGPIHFKSAMAPVDVPITFADDGTFSGESTATFQGAANATPCTGRYASTLKFSVSGKAIEVSEGEHSMHLQLENTTPVFNSFSGQCPGASASNQDTTSHKVDLPFDMTGDVEETLDQPMPVPAPGVVSIMHIEIVKRD
jgi:hypothetical protein